MRLVDVVSRYEDCIPEDLRVTDTILVEIMCTHVFSAVEVFFLHDFFVQFGYFLYKETILRHFSATINNRDVYCCTGE